MRVKLFREPDGSQPVVGQLRELKKDRPDEFNKIFSVKEILEHLTYEQAREGEYIKNVRQKIDAIKPWKKQSRILGWRDGPDFIAAHHVIKQEDSYREEDIEIAQARREQYYDGK